MNNDAREWLEANCPVSMCTQLTEEEVVLEDEKPQLIKLSKCLDFLMGEPNETFSVILMPLGLK